jgi:hypothetical protein
MSDRATAAMIAKIIQDEIGGEVCTPEWAQAAADRIVCAINNNEQKTPSIVQDAHSDTTGWVAVTPTPDNILCPHCGLAMMQGRCYPDHCAFGQLGESK